MAARTPLAPVPRPVAPADALLAAAVALPPSPAVAYALFRPAAAATPHDAIELARRAILARHATPATVISAASSTEDKIRSRHAILDAILPSVHIGPEPFLYAFRICTQHTAHAEAELLASLPLDGLAGVCIPVSSLPPAASAIRASSLNGHHASFLSVPSLTLFYSRRTRRLDTPKRLLVSLFLDTAPSWADKSVVSCPVTTTRLSSAISTMPSVHASLTTSSPRRRSHHHHPYSATSSASRMASS